MKLTIAYLTFRQHPRFEWFCRSLAREFRAMPDVKREDVQVVVIDGRLWTDGVQRHAEMAYAASGPGDETTLVPLIEFTHLPPKPSRWQGPYRKTKKEYFCAASVRNTAFAYARGPHVAFVDDLSVLLPGWLKAHMHAADHGYVLAGTTCKNKNIVVGGDGEVKSFDLFPPGQDSRLSSVGDGLQRCTGMWLYGGTFSVPLELALKVNGQDEINDTIGGEDYDFGLRLERAGGVINISRACGTFEDEDGHHSQTVMTRLDKPWPGPDGPYSSNYLLNRLRREAGRFTTIGNSYDLREIRARVLSGGSFPPVEGPQTHWVDGQPLEEM